jgi:hypothetical protein
MLASPTAQVSTCRSLRFLNETPMFPNPGADFSFVRPRNPRGVTKEFVRKATGIDFAGLRFQDRVGATKPPPCSTKACRCTSSPLAAAMIPRWYCEAMLNAPKKADTSAAAVIGSLSKGALT